MKKLILLVCMGLIMQVVYSQTNVVDFLKGGKANATKLAQAYLQPYAFALADGFNNGWYNSAVSHKEYGFDFSVSLSSIQIPENAMTFDISTLGLTKMVVGSGGNTAPTIAGAKAPGPQILVTDEMGNQLGSFKMPGGTGYKQIPVPVAQVGFGALPWTDLVVRYLPKLKYDNNGDQAKIGFWGLAVKHNFSEWIPALKSLPFDAATFGSYTEAKVQSTLSFNSSGLTGDIITISPGSINNQLLKLKTTTTRYGLIVSKKLGILTFFGGIGRSTSKSTVDLTGKYTVKTTVHFGGVEYSVSDDLINPVSVQFTSKNMCMDAGLRLKISVLSLFASINKSEYTTYNAGLSLDAR